MSAANTDKFIKLAPKWTGTIGSAGVSDDSTTTIPLASTTNLPTDTPVIATIDRVDANGSSTPSKMEGVLGIVSGNNLVSCVRGVEGTAQAHSAGAVVEILVTAYGWNRLVDGILEEHGQDGTHDNTKVAMLAGAQTITGVKSFSATPKTDAIAEKTAATGVTVDGLLIKDGNAAKATVLSTTAKARAYLGTSQTNVGNLNKIELDTESYDPGNNFDTANNKFVVPITGYYQINAMIRISTTIAGHSVGLNVEKNGTPIIGKYTQTPTDDGDRPSVSDCVYLEKDDEITLTLGCNGGDSLTVTAGSSVTFLSIHLLSV